MYYHFRDSWLWTIGHFHQSLLIEYGHESLKLEKWDQCLGLRANLTLIEPNCGPWGPYPPLKVGGVIFQILAWIQNWTHFLVKPAQIWILRAHSIPVLNPEGPPHLSEPFVDPEGPTHPKNGVTIGGSSAWTRNWNHSEVNPTQFLNPRAHPNPI